MGLLQFDMLLPGFVLVLARVAGLLLAVPFFSSTQIPRLVKVWLTVGIALTAYPVVVPLLPLTLTPGQAVAGLVSEFVIGEAIGIGTGLMFFAAQFAGKLISHQTGMALGSVFNPVFNNEATVLDQLWFFTALMFFFAMHGHLAVVRVVLDSFHYIPPMSAWSGGLTADLFASTLQSIFVTAIRLAGPAILSLTLALLALGVLMKTMPQFNILSVGFSIKIAIGLFIMAVTIDASDGVMTGAFYEGLDHIGFWFESVSETIVHGG